MIYAELTRGEGQRVFVPSQLEQPHPNNGKSLDICFSPPCDLEQARRAMKTVGMDPDSFERLEFVGNETITLRTPPPQLASHFVAIYKPKPKRS